MLLSGSRLVRVSLVASIRRPSLPLMPTALPPAAWIAVTISLLILPARTISTTSTVAASVTRSPSTKADWIFSRSSMALICGPPPWTTTGLMPTCLSRTMSRAKLRATFSSPMAWPPYLITITAP